MHGFVCEGEGGCGGGGEAMNRLNVALLQSQRMNQCRRGKKVQSE